MQNKGKKLSNNVLGVTNEYDWVGGFNDEIAFVRKDEKWGFVDKTFKIVIPLEYEQTRGFFKGAAAVKKNGKWGYINQAGEVIIPYQYDEAYSITEGLAAVKQNRKWGFVNEKGDIKVPFIYDHVNSYSDGFTVVSKDQNYLCLGKTGNIVRNFVSEYDHVDNFHEGLARVSKIIKTNSSQIDCKWGCINQLGEAVIPVEYDGLNPFSENYTFAQKTINDSDIIYCINRANQQVFKAECENLPKFHEGLAAVCINIKWQQTERTDPLGNKFSAAVKNNYNESKWGFINTAGEITIPLEYEYYNEYNFYCMNEGFSRAAKGGKQGYIDKTGKIVIPFEYDFTHPVHEGLAVVQKDGIWEILQIKE